MRLRILGTRVLARNYTLPEQIGSIIVPSNVKTQFDGKTFEVVAVSDQVKERVGIGGTRGNEVFPVLADGLDGLPQLCLQPDDIIVLRHMFRGLYAGPEVERHYGCPCYFVEVIEKHGTYGEYCAIERVLPVSRWDDAPIDAEAA